MDLATSWKRKEKKRKTRPIAKIFSPIPIALREAFPLSFSCRGRKGGDTRGEVEINDLEILIQWQGCGVAASCLATSCLAIFFSAFCRSLLCECEKKREKEKKKKEKLRFFVRWDEEMNLCGVIADRLILITSILFVHRIDIDFVSFISYFIILNKYTTCFYCVFYLEKRVWKEIIRNTVDLDLST